MGKIMISRIKSFLLMIHISKTSFDGSENYFLKNRKLFDFFQREFLQSDSRDLQQTNKI